MTSRGARALSPLVVERVRANRTPDPLTRLVICQAGHRRSCPPARPAATSLPPPVRDQRPEAYPIMPGTQVIRIM